MTRTALALIGLVVALASSATGAAAASLKPLPALNGVRCHMVVDSTGLYGYSCGSPSDVRSYVVTIEIANHSPYGRRPDDVRSGSFVRSTRTGASGHVYVMVVATRTDGDVRLARSEAESAAKRLARIDAARHVTTA